MSTSNPFDKLNINREEQEEDDQEFHQVKGKEKNVPYGIEQKKKKVRPKELEKVKDEGEEGFEEVQSKTKKRSQENIEEGEETKVHKKRRGVNYNTQEEREHRLQDKPRRGRQFDRQSGTGRGKEVAKGGAGGKGTWGDNPRNIAKNYENYNDDYYFESALNPQKRKDRPPRRPRKENKEDEKEKEGEEKEGEGETQNEEQKEDKKEKKEKERRKIEIKEEDRLHRPENEMSLDDYLKSKELPKEEEKEVERIKDGKPLTKTEKKKEETLGTTGLGKKKEKKKKEKKVNQEEVDLNFQIGENLEVGEGDNENRRRGGKNRGRGGRGKGGRGRGKGGQFRYNENDFPEFEK